METGGEDRIKDGGGGDRVQRGRYHVWGAKSPVGETKERRRRARLSQDRVQRVTHLWRKPARTGYSAIQGGTALWAQTHQAGQNRVQRATGDATFEPQTHQAGRGKEEKEKKEEAKTGHNEAREVPHSGRTLTRHEGER